MPPTVFIFRGGRKGLWLDAVTPFKVWMGGDRLAVQPESMATAVVVDDPGFVDCPARADAILSVIISLSVPG